MTRTVRALALAGATSAVVILCAPPAAATDHGQTVTRTWYLPAGVDPRTAPFADLFPQTVAANGCAWAQVDTYRYGTERDRALVDALDDDGLLTFDAHTGTPEDAAVYLSSVFAPPAGPCSTSTPTPTSTPSSTPTATETATPTPTPSSPSNAVPPTTSSTVSPSPARPRLVQTDTPDELAATGPNAGGFLALGVALVAAGTAAVRTARRRHPREH